MKIIELLLDGLFFQKVGIRLRSLFYKPNLALSDKKFLIKEGKIRLGYKMNLDFPKTFNEKLNWYKLNYKNKLMITCSDKYEVYDYIKGKDLESILIPLYGVYDDISEINLNSLPNSFVAKVTGDSGGVVVCRDKNKFFQEAIKKLNLKNDYSNYNKEWPYHFIKNRIIVQQLIETKDGRSPKDYKFFCFNGEPKFLYVASDRDTHCKFDFYDLEWNHIPVKQGHPNSKVHIEKPECLDEMLKICKILSKDFPHVRVDLFYEQGKIYFGELTFFHFSGLTSFIPQKYDKIFGEYFDVSKINIIKEPMNRE